MLDQQAGQLKRMADAISAYDVIISRQRARSAISWIDADPKRYDYYSWVKEMIEKYG